MRKLNIIQKYTLSGIAFGLIFPAIALIFDLIDKDLSFNLSNIKQLHIINPLHFIIDTAPLVISLVAFLVGKNVQKKEEKAKSIIENQLIELHEKNEELATAEEELRQNNEELLVLNENIDSQKNIIEQKEQRLASIIKNQGEGFGIIDLNGTFTFCNPAAEEIFEVQKQELIGRNISDFFDSEEINTFIQQTEKCKIGEKIRIELQGVTAKGNTKFIYVTITPDCNHENKILGLSGVFRDITEIKKAENELQQSKHQLLNILNNVQAGIVIVDAETREISFVNPTASELIGECEENITGNICHKFICPAEKGKCPVADLKQSVEKSQKNLLTSEGKIIPILKSVVSIEFNGKKQFLESFVDISDLKEAQRIIEEKTEQQKILINNLPAHIYLKDINLKYVLVNNSYAKLLGYPVDQILGRTDNEISPSDIAEMYQAIDEKLIKTKDAIINFEQQHIDNDIKYWASTSKVPYCDKNGNVLGIIGIVQDITNRKENEHLILEKTRQFENTINNLEDIYYKTDIEGNLLQASPSICKHLGYSSMEEIFEYKVFDQIYKNPANKKQIIETIFQNGKIRNYSVPFKTKNGEIQYGETNAVVWYDSDNNLKGFEGIIRNITERMKLETELNQINNNLIKTLEITEQQKQIIEKAHKNITNSINYAKSIQHSLLTSKELLDNYFNEYFIIFKPKEVVSGDFYYVNKLNNNLIFSVGDCTGHGVAGGFMTMLSITYLHEIVRQEENQNAGKVLNYLRNRVKSTFKTFGNESRNGLDIVFCSVNTETNILQYAGAYNPLFIFRKGELIEYPATKNPIGFHVVEDDFKNNEIQLFDNDLIYLLSDGFQDQFGGDNIRKFTKKSIKEMLFEIHQKPLQQQQVIIENTLQNWKKDIEQIDDITLLGIKWKSL